MFERDHLLWAAPEPDGNTVADAALASVDMAEPESVPSSEGVTADTEARNAKVRVSDWTRSRAKADRRRVRTGQIT